MDATTPPRRDDEPIHGQPAVPPPLIEPVQPSRAGGSTAVGATPSTGSTGLTGASDAPVGSSTPPPAPSGSGTEDPTAPDTAVEATLSTEPAGSSPEEPVVPTARPDVAPVAEPAPAVQPAERASESRPEVGYQPSPGSQPAPAYQTAPAPDFSAHGAPAREVVYVAAPVPPKKKGNRGVGVLLAALSTVLFFIVYVAVVVLINVSQGRPAGLVFLEDIRFYVPVLLFAIGFILLAVIVNRAGWWSFVLGSFFVGAFVYLGTVGLLLLSAATTLTPEDAVQASRSLLISPIVVAAGLVAREVALWVGAAISARGRRVKERNAQARAEFDRQQAEHRAEIERTGAVVRPA